jgi:hypothetical protein
MAKSIPPIMKKETDVQLHWFINVTPKGDDAYEYAEIFFVGEEVG